MSSFFDFGIKHLQVAEQPRARVFCYFLGQCQKVNKIYFLLSYGGKRRWFHLADKTLMGGLEVRAPRFGSFSPKRTAKEIPGSCGRWNDFTFIFDKKNNNSCHASLSK